MALSFLEEYKTNKPVDFSAYDDKTPAGTKVAGAVKQTARLPMTKQVAGAVESFFQAPKTQGEARSTGLIGGNPAAPDAAPVLPGTTFVDPLGAVGSMKRVAGAVAKEVAPMGKTSLQKLVESIKAAGKPRAELEAAYSEERARRVAAGSGVMEQAGGQSGFYKTLGTLKGEMAPEKKAFDALKVVKNQAPNTTLLDDAISQGDVDALFNQIQLSKNLDFFERVGAASGLEKLLNGRLPQKGELALMEDVFGSELIEAVLEKRPLLDKVFQTWREIRNIPRSLITSVDMSAPLRQGILFTTKPSSVTKATKEMFKQAFSQESFDQWLADIPNNPRYRQMRDSKLFISDPSKVAGGLDAREEVFMSNLAEKIPLWGEVVKGSSRAYTAYLNKLRVDVFSNLAAQFEKEGIATDKNLKDLARWINNATGRGDMRGLESSSAVLSEIFFSPRLTAARFNTLDPLWYTSLSPRVRKEALKNLAQFIGAGSTIVSLAAAAGADVEIDPRSTDFGKIKIGNTRIDTWAGFQQWVRLFAQIATGETKNSSTGVIRPASPVDRSITFLRGKLNPFVSSVVDLIEGENVVGEETTAKSLLMRNAIPLYLSDMMEVADDLGPQALFWALPAGFFGVGVSSYGSPPLDFMGGNTSSNSKKFDFSF